MQARKYMIEWREKRRLTIKVMAQAAKVTEYTLECIELDDNYVTHPNIAARIAKAYKLTQKQYLSMIPENYRPGKNYDPDKYVEADRDFGMFNIRPRNEVRGTLK